jgi:hypothetical protein
MGEVIDLDDEGARRLLAAVLLSAAHDAKKDDAARVWLTKSALARDWLDLLGFSPGRAPDLSLRTRKAGRNGDAVFS